MFLLCLLSEGFFYHKWLLNFVTDFLGIYWDNHMFFTFQFVCVYGNAGGFCGGGQRLPELRNRKRHRAVSGQIQASVNHWAAGDYPAQPTLPGTGSPSARPCIIFDIRGTVAAPSGGDWPRPHQPYPLGVVERPAPLSGRLWASSVDVAVSEFFATATSAFKPRFKVLFTLIFGPPPHRFPFLALGAVCQRLAGVISMLIHSVPFLSSESSVRIHIIPSPHPK